jgi:hypothetical protein
MREQDPARGPERSRAPGVRARRRPTRELGALHALALLLVGVLGCGSGRHFERGVYRGRQATYALGPLPAAWREVGARRGDLAFAHAEGGTIYTESACGGSAEDVPLNVLTNHLFFDLRVVDELSREELTLDGRAALRTRIVGELDGVPVALDAVVVKKDGCVYDLVLVTEEHQLPARARDFEAFFAGFAAGGAPS